MEEEEEANPREEEEAVTTALVEMGFHANGARRAARATAGGGTQAAMEWVLTHMEASEHLDHHIIE